MRVVRNERECCVYGAGASFLLGWVVVGCCVGSVACVMWSRRCFGWGGGSGVPVVVVVLVEGVVVGVEFSVAGAAEQG